MSKMNIPEHVVMFLTRLNGKIKRGEYDKYLTIPFASKELLYSNIKNKTLGKLEKGSNPLLSDIDIMECIKETLEVATEIAQTYIKIGFLVKTENGYEVSEIGKKALENK